MINSFNTYLTDIRYPSRQQKAKEIWDVEGRLKNSNQIFKFDVRPLINNAKIGFFKTKADKMVFETVENWLIFDIEELHTFVKDKDIKEVKIETLLEELNWNMILSK